MRKTFHPDAPRHDTRDHLIYRMSLLMARRGWGWRGRSQHRHRKAGRA